LVDEADWKTANEKYIDFRKSRMRFGGLELEGDERILVPLTTCFGSRAHDYRLSVMDVIVTNRRVALGYDGIFSLYFNVVFGKINYWYKDVPPKEGFDAIKSLFGGDFRINRLSYEPDDSGGFVALFIPLNGMLFPLRLWHPRAKEIYDLIPKLEPGRAGPKP
jgi:hypothetical protein